MRPGRALAALSPPPRLVDWGILVLVAAETASGLVSFGAGHPANAALFDLHAVLGLSLVGLLAFKLYRVRRRVARVGRWDRATPLSVVLAVVALAALATGVAWVLGVDVRVLFWTLLSVHVGLGLLLVPLVLVHLAARFRTPSRVDFRERRTAVKFSAVFLVALLAWRLQSLLASALTTAGARRRFTGSKPLSDIAGYDEGDDFPVTSWVADDPDPLARESWRLRVGGFVDVPRSFDYDDLTASAGADAPVPTRTDRALLDCTSGWYVERAWRGVRVGDLLDAAGASDEVRWVRVTSATGYRWSFPVEQARDYLLATHVGGDPLSHGHGAPARLVAPDRRGFQWVKWVVAVEARTSPDAGQYLAVLVSGLD